MEIIWTDDALSDYHQNIDYLITEWSERTASEFIQDVEEIVKLIEDFLICFRSVGIVKSEKP